MGRLNSYRFAVTDRILTRQLPTEAEQLAISRLTEKESECLRRWLNHETAKQIALSLEISHHAVEKRLKSARSKLGVNSSLEAAQMLARAEGYGQPVSQSPDLPQAARSWQDKRSFSIKIGAIIMSLALGIIATLTVQPDLTIPPSGKGVRFEADQVTVHPSGQVDTLSIVRLTARDDSQDRPTEEELMTFFASRFSKFDKNGDGVVTTEEAPTELAVAEGKRQFIVGNERARALFFDRHDRNSDTAVTEAEYLETSLAAYHRDGVLFLEKLIMLKD